MGKKGWERWSDRSDGKMTAEGWDGSPAQLDKPGLLHRLAPAGGDGFEFLEDGWLPYSVCVRGKECMNNASLTVHNQERVVPCHLEKEVAPRGPTLKR